MHANINLTALRVQTHNCKHTHRPQTKQWAWLGAWWRLAWLALNQAGRWSGAQRRPRHHYVWVASSLLLLSKWRRWRAQTSTERGANCHWGACLLWLIINYCAASSKASVSTATSSVKHTLAPASCRNAGRVVLLTALWFGCPLVELELWEQGAILMVLLHIQANSINHFIITGYHYTRLIINKHCWCNDKLPCMQTLCYNVKERIAFFKSIFSSLT